MNLIEYFEVVTKKDDEEKATDVYMDLSNALEKIQHDRLLGKMRLCGI